MVAVIDSILTIARGMGGEAFTLLRGNGDPATGSPSAIRCESASAGPPADFCKFSSQEHLGLLFAVMHQSLYE